MDSSGSGSGKEEIGEMSTKFENFDVLPDVANDHVFLKTKDIPQLSDQTSRNIMKEWKSLRENLPESIYVRAYEPRIDLLRAVIIGSSGTPYHDGLFFFDISLPADYPKQPPNVYYHAHGYRLNPNLYADGMVCLSLINTWYGEQSQKWRTESTILQLLVSLQGLVLNERPFFNEPMYGIGKRSRLGVWKNASKSYNEDAFLLSCKTMSQIKTKPPQGFEDFVVQHFRERSASILAAVNAYEEGRVACGQFRVDGECSTSSSSSSRVKVKVSAKFKAELKAMHPLLEALLDQSVTPSTVVKKDENEEDGSCSSSSKDKHVKKETGFWGILNCFSA